MPQRRWCVYGTRTNVKRVKADFIGEGIKFRKLALHWTDGSTLPSAEISYRTFSSGMLAFGRAHAGQTDLLRVLHCGALCQFLGISP